MDMKPSIQRQISQNSTASTASKFRNIFVIPDSNFVDEVKRLIRNQLNTFVQKKLSNYLHQNDYLNRVNIWPKLGFRLSMLLTWPPVFSNVFTIQMFIVCARKLFSIFLLISESLGNATN